VCRQCLIVLQTEGWSIEDEELLTLVGESSTMSKSLSDYGTRKSPAATTARRLAEAICPEIINRKGLKCEFIMSRLPASEPIAARAIPTIIFKSSSDDIQGFLRKWCKDPTLSTVDFRDIIDWDHYKNRLFGTLQKIIAIPALLQGVVVTNFDAPPPDWVLRRRREEQRMKGQRRLELSVSRERPRVEREKVVRDETAFTDYQRALMKVKEIWRRARVVSIERQPGSPVFK